MASMKEEDARRLAYWREQHAALIAVGAKVHKYYSLDRKEEIDADVARIGSEEPLPTIEKGKEYHREGATRNLFWDRVLVVDDDYWVTAKNPGNTENDYNEILDFFLSHGTTSIIIEWKDISKVDLKKLDQILDLAEKKGMKVEFGKNLQEVLTKLKDPGALVKDTEFLKKLGGENKAKELVEAKRGIPGRRTELTADHFAKRKMTLAENHKTKMAPVVGVATRFKLDEHNIEFRDHKIVQREDELNGLKQAAHDADMADKIEPLNKYAAHLEERIKKIAAMERAVAQALAQLTDRAGVIPPNVDGAEPMKKLQADYQTGTNKWVDKINGLIQQDDKGISQEYGKIKHEIGVLKANYMTDLQAEAKRLEAEPQTSQLKTKKEALGKVIVRIGELEEKGKTLGAGSTSVVELRKEHDKFAAELGAKQDLIDRAVAAAEPKPGPGPR